MILSVTLYLCIIAVNIFLKRMEDFDAINAVRPIFLAILAAR